MGGGGDVVVKSTTTSEIQILSAGYQKRAKTGKIIREVTNFAQKLSTLLPTTLKNLNSISPYL
jgi:hypothetical protein